MCVTYIEINIFLKNFRNKEINIRSRRKKKFSSNLNNVKFYIKYNINQNTRIKKEKKLSFFKNINTNNMRIEIKKYMHFFAKIDKI